MFETAEKGILLLFEMDLQNFDNRFTECILVKLIS